MSPGSEEPVLRIRERDEQGMAVVTAVLVVLVALLLSVFAVQITVHNISSGDVDRKRVQSVESSEAGIDLAIQALQSSPTPPCSLSGTVGSAPTTVSYSVAVTYYQTYPPGGPPLSCPSGGTLSSPAGAALIKSTGASTAVVYGNRAMEALTRLTAVPSTGFNDAIFSDGNMSDANSTNTSGDGAGNDATMYTNGDFTCGNNSSYAGSVVAQGGISITSGPCTSLVDLWAVNDVTTGSGTRTIGGSVRSCKGNISLSNQTTVAGSAYAFGSNNGGTVNGTRQGGNAFIPCPAVQQFPQIWFTYGGGGNSGNVYSAFLNAGYTPKTTSDCSGTGVGSANAIITAQNNTGAVPVLLFANCSGTPLKVPSLSLAADLAVFSTGGFLTSNSTSWQSSSTANHELHLVVPWDWDGNETRSSCPSSGAPGISLGQHSDGTPGSPNTGEVHAFLYTPGAIAINQHSTVYGQVYGCSVSMGNNFHLYYRSTPVFGATGGGGISSYNVDVAYKREVQP